jgi:hypothetical protein
MEVLLAFLRCQVAGDAAAGEREQQVNVHGIDLDDSVIPGGKKAFAVRRPSDATDRTAVGSRSSLPRCALIGFICFSSSIQARPFRMLAFLGAYIRKG